MSRPEMITTDFGKRRIQLQKMSRDYVNSVYKKYSAGIGCSKWVSKSHIINLILRIEEKDYDDNGMLKVKEGCPHCGDKCDLL